jgi:hypothetical protein
MRPRGTIQQRSPGSYRLRYDIGHDASGKRLRATTTVQGTRRDAERELTRLLRTVDTNEHVDPNRITLQQWLETWLNTIKSEISPKAHERYSEIARAYLVPALGQHRITSLSWSRY